MSLFILEYPFVRVFICDVGNLGSSLSSPLFLPLPLWSQRPQVPLWSSPFPFIPPSFLPSLFSSLPLFTPHFSLRNVSEADWGNTLVDNRCIVSQRLLQTHRRGFVLTHSFVFSCPSLVSANEERAGGCHGNPEEAQWHGPQHRGCQGRKHQLEVCVCACARVCERFIQNPADLRFVWAFWETFSVRKLLF